MDPGQLIWRYLDLPRFLSWLQTQRPYFARLRGLSSDPFEGTLPKQTQDIMIQSGGLYWVEEITARARELIRTNCWTGNQKESAAMWRLYGATSGSVAIQTTYERLVDALPSYCIVGCVTYIDYDTDYYPVDNELLIGFHKRIEFEFEKEVRVLYLDSGREYPRVDLATLVERVYVRDTEAQWLIDIVEALLNQYGIGHVLSRSTIDSPPRIGTVRFADRE